MDTVEYYLPPPLGVGRNAGSSRSRRTARLLSVHTAGNKRQRCHACGERHQFLENPAMYHRSDYGSMAPCFPQCVLPVVAALIPGRNALPRASSDFRTSGREDRLTRHRFLPRGAVNNLRSVYA